MVGPAIIQSPEDHSSYRAVTLRNGLQCLLVSACEGLTTLFMIFARTLHFAAFTFQFITIAITIVASLYRC